MHVLRLRKTLQHWAESNFAVYHAIQLQNTALISMKQHVCSRQANVSKLCPGGAQQNSCDR